MSAPKNPLNTVLPYIKATTDELEKLIAEGHNVNEESHPHIPLCRAITTQNNDAVLLLLRHGAEVNKLFNQFVPNTPLMWSIAFGSPTITKILLENGADPNLATEWNTPLLTGLCVFDFGENQMANIANLLKWGANPLEKHNGKTIFDSMKSQLNQQEDRLEKVKQTIESIDHKCFMYLKKKATLYREAGRALVAYKALALDFEKRFGIPPNISSRFLGSADFGLDKYTLRVKCAICYEEGKFIEIPCKNTHTDSICSVCIEQITHCPLCRGVLHKQKYT